jgi:hypothetical protein
MEIDFAHKMMWKCGSVDFGYIKNV